jgi:predicted MPP superfamily phosphohydrolase
MPEKRFSILHTSDFHFGFANSADGREISNALKDRLKTDLIFRLQGAKQPDIWLMTGDMSHKNETPGYSEYVAWVQEILKETDFDPTRIFATPGNHDIETLKLTSAQADLEGLYQTPHAAYPTDLWQAQSWQARLERYQGALTQLGVATCLPKGFHHQRISLGDTELNIVSVNSSWLSSIAMPGKDKAAFDFGKMLLFRKEVDQVRAWIVSNPSDMNILLVHYPKGHYNLRDRYLSRCGGGGYAVLSEIFDLVFCGHTHPHPNQVHFTKDTSPLCVSGFTAGALYIAKRLTGLPQEYDASSAHYSLFDIDVPSKTITREVTSYQLVGDGLDFTSFAEDPSQLNGPRASVVGGEGTIRYRYKYGIRERFALHIKTIDPQLLDDFAEFFAADEADRASLLVAFPEPFTWCKSARDKAAIAKLLLGRAAGACESLDLRREFAGEKSVGEVLEKWGERNCTIVGEEGTRIGDLWDVGHLESITLLKWIIPLLSRYVIASRHAQYEIKLYDSYHCYIHDREAFGLTSYFRLQYMLEQYIQYDSIKGINGDPLPDTPLLLPPQIQFLSARQMLQIHREEAVGNYDHTLDTLMKRFAKRYEEYMAPHKPQQTK